ncbi:glycosyltransferase [Methylobacterium brachiatum]|uniref:rhamnosyltransferase WsaF family glycosyltransferase n=1 Tax=Methylobacterium brachiatum TaxID=269660 RepID=UPI00244A99D9|nr:glycosyltransferase [Methylobacterium brachiatum]MDH2310389.1 glycosyltransferase [Methylobacterium brachiatum]
MSTMSSDLSSGTGNATLRSSSEITDSDGSFWRIQADKNILMEPLVQAGILNLFDRDWYLAINSDVLAGLDDPLAHYLLTGANEGRDPHPLFAGAWYLTKNPDVAVAGYNPLIHYLMNGGAEGRDPHPLFASGWYLKNNPDVASGGLNPLIHYLLKGAAEGSDPHPLFAGAWYLANNSDVAAANHNPLIHYLFHGAAEERDPHPLFASSWYLANNPDVAAAGHNPLMHYLSQGANEGRDPHPLFASSWYLANNPDVAAAGHNPLMHYLSGGAVEGRDPHPLFASAWYLKENPDVAMAGRNPLVHYLLDGAVEGRDPHPLFASAWYLINNPDVAAAKHNPLIHYISRGAHEGRDPNPLFDTIWYEETYADALTRTSLSTLVHYLSDDGRILGTNPNRYFDRNWYLKSYPEVIDFGMDPLAHYALIGADEGKDPGPMFHTSFYATNYPDVVAAGFNPLAHFLQSGAAEGKEPRNIQKAAMRAPLTTFSYADWHKQRQVSPARASLQRRLSNNFSIRPVISLIVPVYKVNAIVFKALVSSVFRQTYPYWELCLAVAYLDDETLLAEIELAAKADSRVKVMQLPENRGISRNSNDALTLATGTFIGLLDHDDALPADALYEMALAIEQDDGDFYYSDKDAISDAGDRNFDPLFKANWSPETMISANYLTHFNVIRRSIVDRVGGWDSTTDGAQDWDIFLRVAAAGARIRHVPKVLYHWRHVHTSVASQGLAAKPYAALGQLTAVRRWLDAQNWIGADPVFTPEGYIRVNWCNTWEPSIAVILFGSGGSEAIWRKRVDAGRLGQVTEILHGGPGLENWYEIVAASHADIIVIAPAAMSPMNADWLSELVGPLENPDVVAVSGKVLDDDGRILDAGWIFSDNNWQPIFRGADPYTYCAFGSAHWYRNYGAASLNGTAFRRSAFIEAEGLKFGLRPDIAFSQKLLTNSGPESTSRIVYNPFALSVLSSDGTFEQWWRNRSASNIGEAIAPPAGTSGADPYFNVNLTLDASGIPSLRPPSHATRAQRHDYEAEAAYFGNALEFSPRTPGANLLAGPREPGPLRIGWILPHFTMPFYGGLMTILRCADYFRREGIIPVFLGLDSDKAETLRQAIALAFPELAAAAEIYAVRADEDINALGIEPLDGAFCTLWTTAFILQKMDNVRQKFYFVQDFEPLFYPAGTTSSLVEQTYLMGFFGICNTEPLKDLYGSFGSPADFFNPAVDTKVFHRRGRVEKNSNDPVTIFNYARPGHPRNCFELLAPALVEVKQKFGSSVQIFTAGADWYPADYGLDGVVEHLGLMPYAATGDLYRGCDIGLVAMATCHPSYLPFELMATGAVVCTNFNRHTGWLLRHEENCYLFDMAKNSVAEALGKLIRDTDLRRTLSYAGSKTIQENHSSWDASCALVHAIVIRQLNASAVTRSEDSRSH